MDRTVTEDRKRKTMTEIDNGLLGTARIDPDRYSPQSNSSPLQRTQVALAGLLHLLVHHRQFYYIIGASGAGLGLAWWLQVPGLAWAVLVLTIGQLWLAEVFNTSLEALTDLTTEGEIRALAKVAKDTAAAGSFIASVVFTIVCCMIFIPALVGRFGG
jgi:diacylglycerol kinase